MSKGTGRASGTPAATIAHSKDGYGSSPTFLFYPEKSEYSKYAEVDHDYPNTNHPFTSEMTFPIFNDRSHGEDRSEDS